MTGTANQIEWAEQIKRRVNDEFDRVARSFRSVAQRQSGFASAETGAIIAILEEKRAAVMLREEAGYFIHDWQEIGGRVRQMIFHDARYQALRRRRLHKNSHGTAKCSFDRPSHAHDRGNDLLGSEGIR